MKMREQLAREACSIFAAQAVVPSWSWIRKGLTERASRDDLPIPSLRQKLSVEF